MALALNNLTKVDMPLNKDTKPNSVFSFLPKLKYLSTFRFLVIFTLVHWNSKFFWLVFFFLVNKPMISISLVFMLESGELFISKSSYEFYGSLFPRQILMCACTSWLYIQILIVCTIPSDQLFPQLCLVLYSICSSLLHSLMMGLRISSLTLYNQLLLFCCVLFLLLSLLFLEYCSRSLQGSGLDCLDSPSDLQYLWCFTQDFGDCAPIIISITVTFMLHCFF